VTPYENANCKDSLWQLANSVVPYLSLWCLAAISMSYSFWITLPLAMIASGFFMRVFIIFHDCGHYSFFRNRKANEIVGVITGILTFFPYYKWRYEHAIHHATSSNLNHRGTGDVWILTVNEYLALPTFRRATYRLYRNPFVMFGLGPLYLLINARFNRKGAGRKERLNTYITNLFLLASIGLLCLLLSWQVVLVVQALILYCSGVAGVWLFYVQHHFEGAYFEEADDWDYFSAALRGSSFYKLPKLLQWVTGNIGFHHVHHLGPRIPNYNLQRLHESNVSLQKVPEIDLRLSLRSLRYRLWDEEQKKFVGFQGIRKL
jgi:acyl-lipid omega-6 desaturase (Delta-12 desaturase)